MFSCQFNNNHGNLKQLINFLINNYYVDYGILLLSLGIYADFRRKRCVCLVLIWQGKRCISLVIYWEPYLKLFCQKQWISNAINVCSGVNVLFMVYYDEHYYLHLYGLPEFERTRRFIFRHVFHNMIYWMT